MSEELSAVFGARLVAGAPPLATVSVAVLRGRGADRRVLLVRRTPERGGFWQLLTGRVEPGERPAEAAARELLEETGLRGRPVDLEYRHAFALGGAEALQLVEESAYAAGCPEGFEPALGHEHDAAEWVPVADALARLPFVGLRRAVARAASLLAQEGAGERSV